MKKSYFKYFFFFLIFFIFVLILPGPNGLIQCAKREIKAKKLEKEIFDLRIQLAIKKLKEEILKKSLKELQE